MIVTRLCAKFRRLYTIYHIQAYTLPLPLNPIKIGIFVSIHHTVLCLAVCVDVLVYYSQNITMTLFTVLLFCVCCYFVLYICTWTLFSLYARPYVFTFYVTVCECHIALKAT